MKKQILNIGTALNRAEQKQIHGGNGLPPLCEMIPTACFNGETCTSTSDCVDNTIEYSVEDLDGFGCQNGTCGYA